MSFTLLIDGQSLRLFHDENIFFSRNLSENDLSALDTFTTRYTGLIPIKDNRTGLLELGKDLYHWLDGDELAMTRVLNEGSPPFIFEIECLTRNPGQAESLVLNAPWEILAHDNEFLTQDAVLAYSPVRRLQKPKILPPLDGYRLGLTFMAASPCGQGMLDYEAEEATILRAVGEQHIDLVVEESGELDVLSQKLANLPTMTVLHLSCHGSNSTTPTLILEDDRGNPKRAGLSDLIIKLPRNQLRLLFLSACQTANLPKSSKMGWAQSLTADMVRAGLPAVLGWSDLVGDLAAMLFAKELYGALARGEKLELAVFAARNSLLNNRELLCHSWHLPRLWLGASGGGKIVGGSKKRTLISPTHGHKVFLGKKQDVLVAAHEMFVGRRKQLKEGLRVLSQNNKAGLLIQGLGRLGKSSLAARLANRCQHLTPAVVFASYDAINILTCLGEALGGSPEAQEIIKRNMPEVLQQPNCLEKALRELCCTDFAPCHKNKPFLLILDDLEQILEPSEDGGPHKVRINYFHVIQAILKTIDPTLTDSRLIITSRFTFALGGLEKKLHTIQLTEFSHEEQQKLLIRQRSIAQNTFDTTEYSIREKILFQNKYISKGNPGLQDVLVDKIIFSQSISPEQALHVIEETKQYFTEGKLPTNDIIKNFMEDLSLDTLLGLTSDASASLLRASAIFNLPVPQFVIKILSNMLGGDIEYLKGLGLLECYDDIVYKDMPSLKVNSLAASRIKPLSATERKDILKLVIHELNMLWHVEPVENTPQEVSIELFRLSLLAEATPIYIDHSVLAINGLLQEGKYNDAATQGIKAILLAHKNGIFLSTLLLASTVKAYRCIPRECRDHIFIETFKEFIKSRQFTDGDDLNGHLAMMYEYGNILIEENNFSEALEYFTRAEKLAMTHKKRYYLMDIKFCIVKIFESTGRHDEALSILEDQILPFIDPVQNPRESVTCQIIIARILTKKQFIDKSKDILNNIVAPALDKINDTKFVNRTNADIAIIHFVQRQFDKAIKLLEQCILYCKHENDASGVAASLWLIAQIEIEQNKIPEATLKIEESYSIVLHLGETEGIAVIGEVFGQYLLAFGSYKEGFSVLDRSVEAYRKLGLEQCAQRVEATIAHIQTNILNPRA